MSNFQLVVLGIFGFFIIIAVLIFSGLLPGLKGPSGEVEGTAVLWGTMPASSINELIEDLNRVNKPLVVSYVEKSADSFDQDLTEALASGRGPDLIMLSRELIYRHADKVALISFKTFSERDFKDTFIEEGELYLTPAGILALPFRVDPMVMYWNRDLFSSAGISLPPTTWEDLSSVTPKFTTKDSSGNLIKSSVAFGEYRNVNHAKDILALLSMQAGTPIIEKTSAGLLSVFGDSRGSSLKPAEAAVRYYTGFSNPVQPLYSWNKSRPNSRTAFLSGDLAVYFGYASEIFGLRSQNPHLNLDVARVPQPKGAEKIMTIGRIEGLAVMRSSKNIPAATQAAFLMTSQNFETSLTKSTFLPPTRRDLLSQKPGDAYMNVFFDSALISKGWLDPAPKATEAIFFSLIDNVVSGRLRISEAVNSATSEIARLLDGAN